ncbi:MAG: hypothetical protein GY830_08490 [Bacteroidetes bacterium]|nr:hypothetical protein [Bacteroidota bacterium]
MDYAIEEGLRRGRQEGRQEGIEVGEKKGIEKLIVSMRKNGASMEFIQKTTGLLEKDIQQILKKNRRESIKILALLISYSLIKFIY